MGLRLLPLPEEHGGIDADTATLVLVAEELVAGDLDIAYYFKHKWRFTKLVPRLPVELADWVLTELRDNARFLPASATTEREAGSDNNLP